MNGCVDAMSDIRQVIAYLKRENKRFRIDTTKIILAGNSAGGMVALHSVYSNTELMNSINTLKPGESFFNPDKIVAVVNLWGALFDSTWLRNQHIPIVSVHGLRDRVVPAQKVDKGLFGSIIIYRYANALHIPSSIKIYEKQGHELQRHFNPLWAGTLAHKRWKEVSEFVANFLYRVLISESPNSN